MIFLEKRGHAMDKVQSTVCTKIARSARHLKEEFLLKKDTDPNLLCMEPARAPCGRSDHIRGRSLRCQR